MAFNNDGRGASQDDIDADGMDQRPSSSRVKKVLIWNSKRSEFEMHEDDKSELRDAHIKDADLWQKFENKYKSLPREDHPLVKKSSLIKAIFLYLGAFIFLILIAYCFFIIL